LVALDFIWVVLTVTPYREVVGVFVRFSCTPLQWPEECRSYRSGRLAKTELNEIRPAGSSSHHHHQLSNGSGSLSGASGALSVSSTTTTTTTTAATATTTRQQTGSPTQFQYYFPAPARWISRKVPTIATLLRHVGPHVVGSEQSRVSPTCAVAAIHLYRCR
jgi:hypothetical protein